MFSFIAFEIQRSFSLAGLGYRAVQLSLKWNIYLEMIEKTKLAKGRVRPVLKRITIEIKG